ncbi:OLC1v1023606C1 [Oldenlandia corymbosa var. corymbosa]|uniref:OLC1v1023606C1 n=1 Tax=Oldenlandia corymbosa var. corymbosa TaxID=529605 RepID=A0AAV1C2Q9_OLDCO|nr:OLC1v1023606C1 [Oldenlandia corymbosa var. corymbosa]
MPWKIFKLPKGITDNIDRTAAHFVWQGDVEGHKLHWKTWRSICLSKFHGGLGMRAAAHMNHALLARISFMSKPGSQPHGVGEAYFGAGTYFLQGSNGNCQMIIMFHARQTGSQARIILWLLTLIYRILIYRLIISFTRLRDGLMESFKVGKSISSTPYSPHNEHLYSNRPGEVLGSLILVKCLMVDTRSARVTIKRVILQYISQRCGAAVETISHLLLDCIRSQHIWGASPLGFDFSSAKPMPFAHWFVQWMTEAP